MAIKTKLRNAARQRRKMHIRKKVFGTAERPRLSVFRSLKHISASLHDDVNGVTITSFTDAKLTDEIFPVGDEKSIKDKKVEMPLTTGTEKAYRVGQMIASIAKDRGIETAVFDRNGFRFHGRVRAVAMGARKGGLKF
ncbi:50S ribosomal protein L18 [bacterium]|nr:50S ribosomal protein L18 [bacterium]